MRLLRLMVQHPRDKSATALLAFNVLARTAQWDKWNKVKSEKFCDFFVFIGLLVGALWAVKLPFFHRGFNATGSENYHDGWFYVRQKINLFSNLYVVKQDRVTGFFENPVSRNLESMLGTVGTRCHLL